MRTDQAQDHTTAVGIESESTRGAQLHHTLEMYGIDSSRSGEETYDRKDTFPASIKRSRERDLTHEMSHEKRYSRPASWVLLGHKEKLIFHVQKAKI